MTATSRAGGARVVVEGLVGLGGDRGAELAYTYEGALSFYTDICFRNRDSLYFGE